MNAAVIVDAWSCFVRNCGRFIGEDAKMLATHVDAERRYHEIRKTALRVISGEIQSAANLDFRLIDDNALSASQIWKQSKQRLVDWDWFNNYGSFKFRYPKRFELALWHRNNLASLSLGRPTYHGTGLRLDFIEGNPDIREIKVFPIMMAAITTYAEALGANEVRVMNPINEEVKNYYQKFGLIYIAKGDYLYSRL